MFGLKQRGLIVAASMIFSLYTSTLAANVLSFPGAEGFGRFALGARGVSNPEVYHVTNLNDSGTGSFRDAVSKEGRIIVFDVSGIIKLTSTLVFKGNTVIAGQTAPGDGVVLYGNRVSFSGANNLIIRYLRIRMGVGGPSGKDAAGVANGRNMIFDHMSVTWGRDETFSINWDSKGTEPADITIQNSIIGQGLQTHSCGGLMQTDGGVTLFRNLYIDNKTRNPKVKGLNQFVNNVVYNWGGGGGYIQGGSSGDSWADVEDNYFVSGPSTGSTAAFVRGTSTFQIYQKGNILDYNKDGLLNGNTAVSGSDGTFFGSKVVASRDGFSGAPKAHPVISQQTSAKQAYETIVNEVGASLPARDDVDEFIVDQLKSLGTKGVLISKESENGIANNVGTFASGAKPVDSDGDGIPDAWEDKLGLNKNDKTDATKIDAKTGYLNIELYLNGLVTGIGANENGNGGEIVVNDPTIQKQGAGSSKQIIDLGSAITDFAYGYSYATGLQIEGMPKGVTVTQNAAQSRYEISGTPTEAGVFNFTVTTIGGAEGTIAATKSGVFTILTKAQRDSIENLPNVEVPDSSDAPLPDDKDNSKDQDATIAIGNRLASPVNKFTFDANSGTLFVGSAGTAKVNIVDLHGNSIFDKTMPLKTGANKLDLKNLKNGIYLITVNHKALKFKIIK